MKMEPIDQLLHRLLADKKPAAGDFEIAYFDRFTSAVVREPLENWTMRDGVVTIALAQGFELAIEPSRIKAVYQDNECIWKRPDLLEKY